MGDDAQESSIGRNLLMVLGVTVVFYGAFQWVARAADPSTAWRLATPLDDAIPFVDWSVYLYSWVYTSMFYPAFVIRNRSLMRRVALGYAMAYSVALVCFWLFPVTSLGFRPEVSGLPSAGFTDWAVKLTFTIDPPMNLFPSLHLAIATLAALAAAKARPALAWLGGAVAVAVAATILTMKQHYLADGIAAVVLALAVGWVTLRGQPADPAPRGGKAVVAYLLAHASFYGAFFLAWYLGVPIG